MFELQLYIHCVKYQEQQHHAEHMKIENFPGGVGGMPPNHPIVKVGFALPAFYTIL